VVRSWINLSRMGKIIEQTQEKLQQVKQQQEDLNRQLVKTESREYVEKEVRNKLNLSRENEVVIILPSVSPILQPTPTSIDALANWQKWVKVFLK